MPLNFPPSSCKKQPLLNTLVVSIWHEHSSSPTPEMIRVFSSEKKNLQNYISRNIAEYATTEIHFRIVVITVPFFLIFVGYVARKFRKWLSDLFHTFLIYISHWTAQLRRLQSALRCSTINHNAC